MAGGHGGSVFGDQPDLQHLLLGLHDGLPVAFQVFLVELGHQVRVDVGHPGHGGLGPGVEGGHEHGLGAADQVHLRKILEGHLGQVVIDDVEGGVLDPGQARPGQPDQGLVGGLVARGAGVVVEEYGNVHGLDKMLEVVVEGLLIVLVVIGGDGPHGLGPLGLGVFGQVHGGDGVGRAHVNDNRNPSGHLVDDDLGRPLPLPDAHHGAGSVGPAGVKPLDVGHDKVHDLPGPFFVDLAALGKSGHDGRINSLEVQRLHFVSSGPVGLIGLM